MTRVASLVVAMVATVSLAAPASAQLRGFIKKKVAEKAVEKVGAKPEEAVTPNAKRGNRYAVAVVGEELTADVLDAAIRGMQTEVASNARSDSLGREAEAALRQRTGGQQESEYHEQTARHRQCVGAYFDHLEAKRLEEMEPGRRKPSTSLADIEKFENAFSSYQMEQARAAQRGDSAGYMKLRRDFWHAQGHDIDTHADTVEADAGCGSVPVKPVGIIAQERADSLRAQARRLREQYHDLGAKASGLPIAQYNVAVERIRTWWDDMRERAASRDGSASKGDREHAAVAERYWTDGERKLLESRRDRLAPLMRKLYGLENW